MKKYKSRYQLAANRRNACLSTGPKTSNGKNVSKMNALKYGLRARQIILHGNKIKESFAEFTELSRKFHEECSPEGPIEKMLVDQIVQLKWRLRRVQIAETAEISLNVDINCRHREKNDPFKTAVLKAIELASAFSSKSQVVNPIRFDFESELKESSQGIDYLLGALEITRNSALEHGELTETAMTGFKDFFLQIQNGMTRALEDYRARFLHNPAQLNPDSLRACHQKSVLEYLDLKIREFQILLRDRLKCEQVEEWAQQSADLLLPERKLESLLRYETSLQKKLFRAMHELERIQRRRLGEHVPAPQVLEISSGS